MVILSVIRQKGQSQSGYFKKTKHAKMFRKTNISYSVLDTETYLCLSGGKNVRFLKNIVWFVYLKHPFWNSLFWFITDDMYCTNLRMKNSLGHRTRFLGICWYSSPVSLGPLQLLLKVPTSKKKIIQILQ